MPTFSVLNGTILLTVPDFKSKHSLIKSFDYKLQLAEELATEQASEEVGLGSRARRPNLNATTWYESQLYWHIKTTWVLANSVALLKFPIV
jgi:hypothetical protein